MRALACLCLPLLFAFGCAEKVRAPEFGRGGEAGATDGSAGAGASGGLNPPGLDVDVGGPCQGPPDPDTSLLCGSEVVPLGFEKPNLYFVIDASGSMNERIESSRSKTKMSAVSEALIDVTRALGHRISYGLAAFPGVDDTNAPMLGCGPGTELFPTQEGDAIECLNHPGGEVHDRFSGILRRLRAGGGSPLSASLQGLATSLFKLEGQTALVLLTDGAPNCNADAQCEASGCIPSIAGNTLPSGTCDADFNCCDSSLISEEDERYVGIAEAACVDERASLEVVGQLREAGLQTFVVGVPGSEPYAEVLNALAEAGGTRRAGETGYYDVSDVEELLESLRAIGEQFAQPCTLAMDEPPTSPYLLNVYFDDLLVVQNSEEGWSLEGAVVTFHGEACDALEDAKVAQVQLVSGCETVVR